MNLEEFNYKKFGKQKRNSLSKELINLFLKKRWKYYKMVDFKHADDSYFNSFLFTKSKTLLYIRFVFSSDIYIHRFLSDFKKHIQFLQIFEAYEKKFMLLAVKFEKMDWFFIPVENLPQDNDMTITKEKKYRFHTGFKIPKGNESPGIPQFTSEVYLREMDEPIEHMLPPTKRKFKKLYSEWMYKHYTFDDLERLADKKRVII